MLRKLLMTLAVLGALFALPAAADTHGSLFVNLTTDEAHRANMALVFAKSAVERGHPVAIWLNDKGVFLATRTNAAAFAGQQTMLGELMAKGVTVIVCPYCMKHYGVTEGDLIAGAKVSNPELTGSFLFKDDAKTLSW